VNDLISEALLGCFKWLLPEMALGVAACVLFLGATFRTNRHLWGGVALIGLIIAGFLTLSRFGIAVAVARTDTTPAQNTLDQTRQVLAKLPEGERKEPQRIVTEAEQVLQELAKTSQETNDLLRHDPTVEARREVSERWKVLLGRSELTIGSWEEKLKKLAASAREPTDKLVKAIRNVVQTARDDYDRKTAALQAEIYNAPVLYSHLALLIKWIALGGGLVLVLFSWNEVPDRQAAEYHACLLLIVAGICLTAAANELVTLFLALELVSIPTYILMYLPRHDNAAQEAALKYFLLSVFSSSLTLFGFSYLYGLAGTTNLSALHQALNGPDAASGLPRVAVIALIMVVAGLGFRITMVPFHFYAPDVYQGTPTVVAALLAFVTKVAGFVALLRVLGFVLAPTIAPRNDLIGMALSEQGPILLWILAAVTMFLGNLLALLQDNIKRMLAYSSVAHAGYMLIALAVAPYLRKQAIHDGLPGPDGVEAVLFYLVAYGAMTVGAFAVLAYLSTPRRPVENVDDLAGLSRSHPGVALTMSLFLFSLIGIPLTAGFTGKLMIFFGAMAVTEPYPVTLFRVLALLGVINAAIGAWYYLRIVAVMYLRSPIKPLEKRWAWAGFATLCLCAVLTLGLSVRPGAAWLLEAARDATGVKTASQEGQR
jgi:NADH-quinone oxidoreductase subunit N